MSEVIRRLVSGKPMTRREFMSGMAGAAAGASSSRVPVPPLPAPAAMPSAPAQSFPEVMKYVRMVNHPRQGIVLEDLIDEMPSGEIASVVSDAGWGGGAGRGVSAEEFKDLVRESLRASRALEGAPPLPTRDNQTLGRLVWNPEAGAWEQEFDVVDWKQLSDEEFARAADTRRRMERSFTPDGAAPNPWEDGPLTRSYPEFRRTSTIDGERPESVLPTDEVFDGFHMPIHELGQAYGHVPKRQKPQTKKREPEQPQSRDAQWWEGANIVPYARRNIGPQPAGPDAVQLSGNLGLPGDEPTERMGRIRRLLGVAIPVTAAAAGAGRDE